jgi:type II secretory pathway predicted ATPase ExeA
VIPETPFAPGSSRQSFLETLGAGEALRRLDDSLGSREPFLLVTGEPGTGKTTLAQEAIARWGPRVTAARLAYTSLTGAELLEELLRRFGAEPPDGASRPKLVARLEQAVSEIAGRGQFTMIVVDDAHNLSADLLEELRQLAGGVQQSGHAFEILLLGLPSLESRLQEPALAAVRQRISVRAKLSPLSPGETRRYLRHRVTAAGGDGSSLFPRKTCLDIAGLTGGVPREINLLAAESLRLARAAGSTTVETEHVQAAADALRGELTPRDGAVVDDTDPDDLPAKVVAAPIARAGAPVAAPKPTVAPVSNELPREAVAAPKPVPEAATHPAPIAVPRPTPGISPIASPSPASSAAPKPAATAAPSPAASAAPKPVATSAARPAQAASPSPEPKVAPRAEPIAAPAPPRQSVPVPARVVAARDGGSYAPQPAATAPQDPREWVSRFLGDRGPIQIGSQAGGPKWTPLPEEYADSEAKGAGGAPAARRPRSGSVSLPSPRKRGRGLSLTSAVAMLAIVAAAAVLLIRAGGFAKGRDTSAVATTGDSTAAAVQTTKAARAASGSTTTPSSKTSQKKAATTAPRPSPEPPASSSERSVLYDEPASSRSKGPFTLEVGNYLDLERAFNERDRMQALTGIEGWVIPAPENGSDPHRVVLGIYRSYDRANSAARMLRNSNTLGSVTVTLLPKKSARR